MPLSFRNIYKRRLWEIAGIIPEKHEQKNDETDNGRVCDLNLVVWLYCR